MIDWPRYIRGFVPTTTWHARPFGLRTKLLDSHLFVVLIGVVLFGTMLLATWPLRTFVLKTADMGRDTVATSAKEDATRRTDPLPKVALRLIKLSNMALSGSFLLLALMILSAKFVAYRSARGISQPISVLSYAIRRLAAGRAVEDLAIHRDDELEDLINSFNELRNTVARDRTELRDTKHLLVEQRRTVAGCGQSPQLALEDECAELMNVSESIRELRETLQDQEEAWDAPSAEVSAKL